MAIGSHSIIAIEYGRQVMEEKADLSAFKKKPTPRIIAGIGLMVFSYIIGWPLVSFLGFLSFYFSEPLIVIIGGPLAYGISHLVFLLGMYLAGAKYTVIFFKWATRKFLERYNSSDELLFSRPPNPPEGRF